jgi:hypothetical protein
MRWRRAGAVVALAAALATGGCTGRAQVDVTVTSAATADVVMAVELTGDAAMVTNGDPAILDELVATVASRTGTTPQVDSSPDLVRVSAPVAYAELTASAAVTGVSQITLTPDGDRVRARVSLTGAPDLLAAVQAATAGEPDADALAATLARSTLLVLTVRFPGGVSDWSVTGSGGDAAHLEGDTVTVSRVAADAGAGLVDVTGDPRRPVNVTLLVVGSFAVLVAGAGMWARRRDMADGRLTR